MRLVPALLVAFLIPAALIAEDDMPRLFEDFTDAPMTRWDFVADGVMGGVSQGQAAIVETPAGPAMRLTGTVRLENNGGFIQVRRRFEGGFPAQAEGLSLEVRGNGESYYVFLRLEDQKRVFHSWRHTFSTSRDWQEVHMSFDDFYRSHAEMTPDFSPDAVTGIGIVAYGRAFEADVTVRRIGLF